MDLHMLVEHVGPLHAGEHVFRVGDPFEAIAAVRAGTVKTYVVDRDGREHVLGFHFPGEVIGLDAIDGDTYPCNAVALDRSEEHTSELQSLMRSSYAVFCLKKKNTKT